MQNHFELLKEHSLKYEMNKIVEIAQFLNKIFRLFA